MKTEERFDLPQGTLDLLIMRVVSLGPIHGYAIAQRIQQMSCEALQVQQGSLYPALHRLEYKKMLSAEWQPTETGREAKFYQLTARGREVAELCDKCGLTREQIITLSNHEKTAGSLNEPQIAACC
jgi:PadR family transcriptional regulator, regulatory protein PadR